MVVVARWVGFTISGTADVMEFSYTSWLDRDWSQNGKQCAVVSALKFLHDDRG